jgi:hypothetical protein
MSEIVSSVGIRNGMPCYNRISDQRIVIDLLNRIPESEGGTLQVGGVPAIFPELEERHCSPELHTAILRFQEAHPGEIQSADGHVDPGLNTIRALNRLAALRRPALVLSRRFIFNVFSMEHFNEGPLGTISAVNDVSIRMSLYRFGPRNLWEPLLRLTQATGWCRGT